MAQIKNENTKRLARNTLYLYFRSIFCLLISLYSSRLILNALGVDDYGINNVVAGFASMFELVTGSFSLSISRFLTYEQGTRDKNRQRQVFSISLTIMMGFSLIIFLLALTVGDWYITNKMTIPMGREMAAIWVFYFAIFSVITSLIATPFNASIVSHEQMGVYAVLNIFEAVLRLGLAFFLTYGLYNVDRLILFTAIWTLCTLLIRLLAVIYALFSFHETHYHFCYNKTLFKEMFRFAGWSFVYNTSDTLNFQGTNLILNFFFGPAVNAARGLAVTVHNAVSMFVNNFTVALVPQVTKAFAKQEVEYIKYLTFKGSRFAFFIFFFISLPVIIESDFVFSFWLGDVPAHTIWFCRLALINKLLVLSYAVFSYVQGASGKIRNYNLCLSIITIMELPATWLFLEFGYPPEVVYLVNLFAVFLIFITTYFFVKKILGYNLLELFREVYFPELKVVLCSAILPVLSTILLPFGIGRFFLTCLLCVSCTLPSVLFIGCNKQERYFIYTTVRNYINRFV